MPAKKYKVTLTPNSAENRWSVYVIPYVAIS
jgi:hypothetical protein